MKDKTLIGRVIATEKYPTTMNSFCFWTDKDLILNPFDVVIVENESNGSQTFAVIEEISHITDSASFLADFISSDFGDVNVTSPTHRIGMNYVKASVVGNSKNIFIPVQSNAKVRLASEEEISTALGFDDIRKGKHALICGYLEMYENANEGKKITLPVPVDSRYLIGPEGAHLNISGISGLAAKTSYAMFLLKSIQDKQLRGELKDDDVAFVIFNVKGKDLLAIDEENTFDGDERDRELTHSIYNMMGITPEPFKNVRYFYPHKKDTEATSYVDPDLLASQKRQNKAYQYKFIYEDDRENLDLLFADIDDSTQTMDSILNNIISGTDGFDSITSWHKFVDRIEEKTKAGTSSSKDIPVQSWRKFFRLIRKSIDHNPLFGTKIDEGKKEIRLQTAISRLEKNSIYVIDIAQLPSDMQGFVFGNVIRDIYNLQLGVVDGVSKNKPSKIVIFMDELNKFASTETPKNSPILRQILDIAERGRSLGVILFGAEQFKSALHSRVSGNSSTFAYGRTNAIELSKGDYKYVPQVYKSMMTRLKQGEYIVQNPIFKSLLQVKFPKPLYKQFK